METKFGLSKEQLVRLSRKSCSEGNFASKLLSLIFSKDELVGRNCNGKRGKEKLDPVKLGYILQAVVLVFNVNQVSREDVWKKCVVAMDEFFSTQVTFY